jgi:hypothetical protein
MKAISQTSKSLFLSKTTMHVILSAEPFSLARLTRTSLKFEWLFSLFSKLQASSGFKYSHRPSHPEQAGIIIISDIFQSKKIEKTRKFGDLLKPPNELVLIEKNLDVD